ncbi:MAG: YpdA family putative bacillithiol disulfide reductase [Acidobacteria bacterium]|nr:YpdA family putative bacillithiol disulfide reductase [Acidobacteriota bacterium]MBI3425048.1 YpdA family putative bacillithiol disulfide reductase [Acidobacteriota bacterium]
MEIFDVIIIGGGPTGLACAIEAQRAGLSYLVLEKGCVVNSLYHYPTQMVFFTTPELLEIGDLPFVCEREKPNRIEALKYYRRVADTYRLRVHQYEKVVSVTGRDGDFTVQTEVAATGEPRQYQARKLIIAIGYYDQPNRMGIPGEDLPKVSHYYKDAHPYYARDVAVIGAGNSAALAALDLVRHGARVTLIHRGAQVKRTIKYWILPDIENRIASGEVTAYFEHLVTAITPAAIQIRSLATNEERTLSNEFVFALTGYHTDNEFLQSLGIAIDPATLKPAFDPDTLESNARGVYLAGVVIAGKETGKIFIENGRFHGGQVARAIRAALAEK